MAMNVGAPGAKKGGARPEMNVTPLVDVVLVLLIIFMVIMPLMPAQFWVHVPDKPDQEDVT
ncbi:MAG: biopolymer transporter ExbD, partial [Myxococcales bacterium]